MPYKLYFRFGTMSSSKTANLLMVFHNYKLQNKKVLLVKPFLDDRFGYKTVKSRTGLEQEADLILKPSDSLITNCIDYCKYSAILVDEVQFLTENQVEQLRILTLHVPVMCYGLRTDYKTKLFPASKRLMELADSIEEIKTTCTFCNKKSIINLKHVDGNIVKDGDNEIELGTEEKYLSSCWVCWFTKTEL